MNHILITNRAGKTTRFHMGALHWGLLFTLLAGLIAGSFYYGTKFGSQGAKPGYMVSMLQKEMSSYQSDIDKVKQQTQENINALASRIGELKAHVIRLDAMGEQLIEKAKLDKGEFDFGHEPAMGGPETANSESYSGGDLTKELDALNKRIDHSSMQLGILENLLMNRNLHDAVFPNGRPIKHGWISSYFGYRIDPFTGRRGFHKGLDFANKKGTPVRATASGIVTWAGSRYGYGNLVEINHGNGLVTRYGHNYKVLVKVGDQVKRDQVIAKMGSTGRSTGPHCHYEVILNGRAVDPMPYVDGKRYASIK